MKLSVRLSIMWFFLFLPTGAYAACTVFTTGINFGSYDVFSTTPTDSTATIMVTCDETPAPTVAVSIGASPTSGGFNPRKMKHASQPDLMNYNLFTDAPRTVIWGDGTSGTATETRRVRRGTPVTLTVYGRIFSGQDVSAGSYSETLTVTITW